MQTSGFKQARYFVQSCCLWSQLLIMLSSWWSSPVVAPVNFQTAVSTLVEGIKLFLKIHQSWGRLLLARSESMTCMKQSVCSDWLTLVTCLSHGCWDRRRSSLPRPQRRGWARTYVKHGQQETNVQLHLSTHWARCMQVRRSAEDSSRTAL